jgi:hypothetical protein
MTALPEITWLPGIELPPFACFGSGDTEIMRHECVEDYLDDLDQGDIDDAAEDGIIRVIAYNRDMPSRESLSFLDDLMKRIDEERTDLDGDWQDNYITGGLERLKAAEQAFIDLFLANYDPWGCVPAATILVPVDEGLKHTGEK